MKYKIIILILLGLVIGGELLPADTSVESLASKYRMKLRKGGYSSRFMLKKDGAVCVFGPGIHQMVIDSRSIPLEEAPHFRDGRLFVSPQFVALLKQHIINAEGTFWQTVTIDAGHGGKDPGAISPCNGLYEKTVVLDISKRVKSYLRRKGVKVIMTRERDVLIPLDRRPHIANKAKSHVFVSIHADACEAPGVDGVTVYYGDDWPNSNINVRTRANFLAGQMDLNHFVKGSGRRRYKREEEAFVFGLMVGESNKQGKILAQMIADGLSKGTGAFNRGIRTQNFRVIRRCASPAVLVETGYLTNARDARRLARGSERDKVAKVLSEIICRYLKKYVKKK